MSKPAPVVAIEDEPPLLVPKPTAAHWAAAVAATAPKAAVPAAPKVAAFPEGFEDEEEEDLYTEKDRTVPESVRVLIEAMPRPLGFTIRPFVRDEGDVVPVYITTLPKGTLLFRGLRDLSQVTADVAGIKIQNNYCMSPNYNVFFFPFPFIDETVGRYEVFAMYVTEHDIQIGCFINPCPLARADRNILEMPITTCDKVDMVCGHDGREYDPCYATSFANANTDVTGMIGIAGADRAQFYAAIEGEEPYLRPYLNRYFGLYSDSHNIIPAIPEIILHPQRVRPLGNINVRARSDMRPWMMANRDNLNYLPYRVFSPRETRKIKQYIDDNLASGVFSVDTTTGFFVVTEMVDEAHRGNLVKDMASLNPSSLRFTPARLAPVRAATAATNAAGSGAV